MSNPVSFVLTRQGFYQQEPLPSADELRDFYRDKYFQAHTGQYQPEYSDMEREWFRLDARISIEICRSAGASCLGTLLDVGCGEGFFMAGMKEQGFDVLGCDYSRYAIEHFHPELVANFSQGDAIDVLDKFVSTGRQFDFINLGNILEHVRDPGALLQICKKMMAPGSILRIDVPNDFSVIQRYLTENEVIDRDYWTYPFEHLSYFSSASLSSILNEFGFSVIDILGDFPIENFLLHPGSNYVKDRNLGKAAHKARIVLDLLYSANMTSFIDLMRAQARCGIGRSIVAFARIGNPAS